MMFIYLGQVPKATNKKEREKKKTYINNFPGNKRIDT